jgi:hypothetical protein
VAQANTVKIKTTVDREQCQATLKAYEILVAERGIRFKDNLQWPDQYVVTWKDPLHFKIANWVHRVGLPADGYTEQESWEVELSQDNKTVLSLQKPQVDLKNILLVLLGLVLVSVVLIAGKWVPRVYVGLAWAGLFLIFFFRVFIFDDETTLCVRFLGRVLNPE